MQLSQLYRRGVVRPLDEFGALQLAAFRVESSIRVEWLPILSEAQFAGIWEAGVLQRIGNACGINISDYEEVELAASRISQALNAMQYSAGLSDSNAIFCRHLESLLLDAMATNKCVYFVL